MLRFFKTEHELCNEFAQARATGRLPYKCNGNEREVCLIFGLSPLIK